MDDIDWENQQGVSIKDIIQENRRCIGDIDPISLQPIAQGDEIKFDNQCYSKRNLLDWLQKSKTLPHNRRNITENEFYERDYRGGVKRRVYKKRKSRKSNRKIKYTRKYKYKKNRT
jgi:hypothetical protein